jgi:hypothetical protein
MTIKEMQQKAIKENAAAAIQANGGLGLTAALEQEPVVRDALKQLPSLLDSNGLPLQK